MDFSDPWVYVTAMLVIFAILQFIRISFLEGRLDAQTEKVAYLIQRDQAVEQTLYAQKLAMDSMVQVIKEWKDA